jgi:hypothetical protein
MKISSTSKLVYTNSYQKDYQESPEDEKHMIDESEFTISAFNSLDIRKLKAKDFGPPDDICQRRIVL